MSSTHSKVKLNKFTNQKFTALETVTQLDSFHFPHFSFGFNHAQTQNGEGLIKVQHNKQHSWKKLSSWIVTLKILSDSTNSKVKKLMYTVILKQHHRKVVL